MNKECRIINVGNNDHDKTTSILFNYKRAFKPSYFFLDPGICAMVLKRGDKNTPLIVYSVKQKTESKVYCFRSLFRVAFSFSS